MITIIMRHDPLAVCVHVHVAEGGVLGCSNYVRRSSRLAVAVGMLSLAATINLRSSEALKAANQSTMYASGCLNAAQSTGMVPGH
jgi:hypothetical protein